MPWKKLIGPIFVLVIFMAALLLLHRELENYQFSDFRDALARIPRPFVVAAVLLTFLNYAILIGYDWLGMRFIGHPMSFRKIALASFLGCAVGNNFGSLLGGSTVRYRLYSHWGLTGTEMVKLVVLLGITFWIGLLGLAGIVMVLDPAPIPERLSLPIKTSFPLGIAFCVFTAVYLTTSFCQHKLVWRNYEFAPPPIRFALLQYLLTAIDFIVAAAVLYVLLPASFTVSFWHFLSIFLLAMVLAVVSTVPGGLGVFELTIIVLLNGTKSHELVGSLLAFRLIYYLIPLAVGMVLLVVNEIRVHGKHLGEMSEILQGKQPPELQEWKNKIQRDDDPPSS